jgi:hypothetical protein
LVVTVGATQAAEDVPALKMPIFAPGAGEVEGEKLSQTIECGALLLLVHVTCVPDLTVIGL